MSYVIRLSETIATNPFCRYLVDTETGLCQRDGFGHILRYETKEEAQTVADEMNRKFGISDRPDGYSRIYVAEAY